MSCKRFVGGSVLTLFAAVLLLAPVGCGSPSPEPGAEAAGAGPVSIGEGDPAPAFTLEDLEGNPVHLADSTGQVRLLDFWATWCAPCREEIPMLNELHEKFSDQGLLILAISDIDEDAAVVGPFVEEHGVVYGNLLGSEEVMSTYKVLGLPTAYLIDREGRIVKKFFGPKPPRILEGEIVKLLEGSPAT